jgi:hypothetical protein
MSHHAESYMLEIDGVRAALSMAPGWLRMCMDSVADEYLRAVNQATDPVEYTYPDSYLRPSGVLTIVHFLRANADEIIPVLQCQEDTPGLSGVTEAYESVLDQLQEIAEPIAEIAAPIGLKVR